MSGLKFAVLMPRVSRAESPGGGHLNTLRFAELLSHHVDVRLVSYREEEDDVWFLPRVEDHLIEKQYVFVLMWGEDVSPQIRKYHGRAPILYYHKGIDFGVKLKDDIPILCNSKYLMAHAQEKWPANPAIYVPPVLDESCRDTGQIRDIDVLVIARKQPAYVTDTIVPRLRERCRVHVLNEFVSREDLFRLFGRSRVYVYSFAPQRSRHSVTGWREMEGFGTQALEALVCGCTVFSNLRGGMADFIEPSLHGYRIESHSPEWDVTQILDAVQSYPQSGQQAYASWLRGHYGEDAFHTRARAMLAYLEKYYAFSSKHEPNAEAFGFPKPLTALDRSREATVGALYRLKRKWMKRSAT